MIKNRITLVLLGILHMPYYMHAMANPEDALKTNLGELILALNTVQLSLQPATGPQLGKRTKNYKVRCKNRRCWIKGQGHRRKMGHKKRQLLAAIENTQAAQSENPTTFNAECGKRACRFRQTHHKGKGHHRHHHGKHH